MGYRTRFQETENSAADRLPAGQNRQGWTKLDLRAFDFSHRDGRLQPGLPGLFPLTR